MEQPTAHPHHAPSAPLSPDHKEGLRSILATLGLLILAPLLAIFLTSFVFQGSKIEVFSILARMIDLLKGEGITGIFTSLVLGGDDVESSELNIPSLIDTWLIVRELEFGETRTRGLYVLKSRGMAHSKQVREFLLTSNGIELLDFKTPKTKGTGL